MSIRLYGIATCDTCRRARRWLDEQNVMYEWIDVRKSPPATARLEAWRDALGDAALINKRSRTWRDFDAARRQAAIDAPVSVLPEHPTLLKRPILETGRDTLAGFSPERYAAALGDSSNP